jgi:hypothetical protein
MKTLTTPMVRVTLMTLALALAAGCGLQEGENTPPDMTEPDAGNDPVPEPDAGDSGTNPDVDGEMPAPVVSPAACRLEFHDAYISGSQCGEVRGTLPGMTWEAGPVIEDTDGDGRLELTLSSVPGGTYSLSYMDRECDGQTPQSGAWAHYGDPEMLLAMTSDARAWLYCNWYDAATGTILTDVENPGCNIRVAVGADCALSGAGNMRDFE